MRYDIPVTGPAAQAAGTEVFNIVAGATAGFVLTRLIVSVGTDSAIAPINQNIRLGLFRTTTRGTQTSTVQVPNRKRLSSTPSPITGVDTAWSSTPTLDEQLLVININTASGADIPFEGDDGIFVAQGAANGIELRNLTNAVPAGHRICATATIEC